MTNMNRRHFLMSTAVMAGGAADSWAGEPERDGPDRRSWAAAGGAGSHVAGWPKVPNVEIVALCDVDRGPHRREAERPSSRKG